MKIFQAIALSLVGGIAIGSIGVKALHAQAKPPVYMIAMNEVTDPAGYANEYLPQARASIKAHGGRYVAAGTGTVIDGNLPKARVVVLAWDSMDQLSAWRHSPEYEAARKIGEKFAKYNLVAVPGVAQ